MVAGAQGHRCGDLAGVIPAQSGQRTLGVQRPAQVLQDLGEGVGVQQLGGQLDDQVQGSRLAVGGVGGNSYVVVIAVDSMSVTAKRQGTQQK